MITNKAIYNYKKKDLKRRILIGHVRGVTVSTTSDEFVIHCNDAEHDIYYVSKDKKVIIAILSQVYFDECKEEMELRVMEEKDLEKYVTKKKEKKENLDNSNMPTTNKMSVSLYLNGGTQEKSFEKTNNNSLKKGIIKDKGLTINDFEISKMIGKGSTAKIYLALYKRDKQEVYAIKSIRKDQIISQEMLENILEEKRILAQNTSPFILYLSTCFSSNDRIYFVTPFIPGGDLYHYMQQQPDHHLSESAARFYLAQVALAIQYFHDFNIVYRDLKPENILIDEDGYIKLCDFGSSLHLKDKGDTGFAGAPEYMSPEMIEGKGYGTCSDWWSFGILMYELLFGYPPFYDTDQEKLFNLIQLGELKFPVDIKVSNHAMEALKKLLNRNPAKRIGTNGISEIEKEYWFSYISFKSVLKKKETPPYKLTKLTRDMKLEATNFDEDIGTFQTQIDPSGNEVLAESPVEDWIGEYQEKFKPFEEQYS